MDKSELASPRITESRRAFLASGARMVALSGVAAESLCAASVDDAAGAADLVLRAARLTASPDGRQREVWGCDGQLPGPLIRVKEGARACIQVENRLPAPTSIHWHGFHQCGSPTMDGVEGVSHQPIAPGESFVYAFVAEPFGTHKSGRDTAPSARSTRSDVAKSCCDQRQSELERRF